MYDILMKHLAQTQPQSANMFMQYKQVMESPEGQDIINRFKAEFDTLFEQKMKSPKEIEYEKKIKELEERLKNGTAT